MSTTLAKKETVVHNWYVIDATDLIVGRLAVAPPVFFHVRLEDVPATAEMIRLQALQFISHCVVVQIVEFLDDLERPTAVEDIAANDLGRDTGSVGCEPCILQHVRCVAEEEVRSTHQLVEVVQRAAGSLDILERFGHLADRFDRSRVVAGTARPSAGRLVGHGLKTILIAPSCFFWNFS